MSCKHVQTSTSPGFSQRWEVFPAERQAEKSADVIWSVGWVKHQLGVLLDVEWSDIWICCSSVRVVRATEFTLILKWGEYTVTALRKAMLSVSKMEASEWNHDGWWEEEFWRNQTTNPNPTDDEARMVFVLLQVLWVQENVLVVQKQYKRVQLQPLKCFHSIWIFIERPTPQ